MKVDHIIKLNNKKRLRIASVFLVKYLKISYFIIFGGYFYGLNGVIKTTRIFINYGAISVAIIYGNNPFDFAKIIGD